MPAGMTRLTDHARRYRVQSAAPGHQGHVTPVKIARDPRSSSPIGDRSPIVYQ
jgi:hypothetical protein